jgi:NADPH:quinone reductase-like Zn-dependent oxidoreductase
VVLPLGISTASAGLYQKDYLALPLPSIKEASKQPVRTLVIWGGSSSVGSCAIQLAVASGVEVFTTASGTNFEYTKELGASKVFDYHDTNVEDQIVDALKGKTLVGVYHAAGADGAVQSCARIADRSKGKTIVVTVRGVPNGGIPTSVRIKAISSSTIFQKDNPVGPGVWRTYLPQALAHGALAPKPDPLIVGNGLRSVQLGLDKLKAGVSAQKVVVNHIDEDSSHEVYSTRTKV